MSCEYCGRTNTHDGHGGCYSCGAPLTYDEVFAHDFYADCTSVAYVSTDMRCTAAAYSSIASYVSPKLRKQWIA